MTLRYLQVFIREDASDRLTELLEGRDILGTWRDDARNDRLVVHLIAPTEQTEPIMDSLEDAFSDDDSFHVVLLDVQAVFPRYDPAEEDDEAEADTDNDKEDNRAIAAGRISREELYHDVTETLDIDRVFIATTVLSAIVAAVGLTRNDVAVIIGAMVIAPLLGPNVAMSLAATLGDVKLLLCALKTNIAGIAMALAVAVAAGATFKIDPAVESVASRTGAGIGDIALAIAAGAAGTFAFTRGLSNAVIGVMVAVALVPPLVVFGLLLGAGRYDGATGALMLVVTNVVAINLAGVATFFAQGVRPRKWAEKERAKRATAIALIIWCLLLAGLCFVVFFNDLHQSPRF